MLLAFDRFELDLARFELRANGRRVALEPRVLDFLAYMARRPGRLVSKDELLDAIWPDRVVSEASLSRCVSDARKVLGDAPRSPRILETVHRRGFRFVAPVRETSVPGAGAATDGAPAFVGRRAELDAFRSALQEALAGRPRVVLVSGEPGIGKTRTAEEFGTIAARSGALVRVGRCREEGGAPAYWPWVQILRQEHADLGTELFADLCRGVGAEVDLLVPELASRPRPVAAASAEQRFRLLDSVSRYFGRVAESVPRCLVLDDLHRADAASLRLLAFLIGEQATTSLVVVATCRDAELARRPEIADLVAEVVREGAARCLPLSGLSTEEVGAFVAASRGSQAPPEVVDSLFERTAGNPFFLSQLVPLLDESFRVPALPAEARAAVARQLDGLSDDVREVLGVAAAIGREFPVELVQKVMGTSPDVRAALDRATAVRILGESPERRGACRFSHSLVREVLYDALGSAQRASLHGRIARALEALCGLPVESQLAELAHHFSQSDDPVDRDRAVAYLVQAAEWETAQAAYEQAVSHYERALERIELAGAEADERRCEVLLRLGAAYIRAGDRARAQGVLDRAARTARALDSPVHLARAALALAPGFFALELGVFDPELVDLLEEALERIGDRDPGLRARLLARLATAVYWREPAERRRALVGEAERLLARGADRATRADVLGARCSASWGCEDPSEQAATTREIVELADEEGDHETSLVYRLLRISSLLELGAMHEVDQEIRAFARIARELRQPQSLWYVHLFRAMRAHLQGRLDVCAEEAERVLEIGGRLGDRNAVQSYGAIHVTLHWERVGDDAQLELLRHLSFENPRIASWRCAILKQYCELDRRAEAADEFRALLDLGIPDKPRDVTWVWDLCILGDAAAYLGDVDAARCLYERLAPCADRFVVVGLAVLVFGSVSRVLGNLAAALGDLPAAGRHFEAALAGSRRIGSPLWTAHTQLDLAGALARAGERERASALAADALDLARRHGLATLERRILALRDSLAWPRSGGGR